MHRLQLLVVFALCVIVALAGADVVRVRTDNLLVEAAADDSLLAVAIGQNLQPLIDDFQKRIGLYTSFPLRIVVAANHTEYQRLVRDSGGVLEFSQAHYNRRSRTVYVRHPGDLRQVRQLGTILLHEYIHAYVDHYWRDAPLWFHEGMAVYFSEGVSLERSARYAFDTMLGNRLILPNMNSYPQQAVSWELFYTKSALAVHFFYTQHRQEFFILWDEAPRNGGRFNNALALAMGVTTEGFSRELESWLKKKVGWEMILASSSFLWSVFPLLLLVGWLRGKWRNRRTRRQWALEEEVESEE
ncbi:MAG: hypothetical protein K8R90_00865 [Candidatus Cloacimonetes bacterium]|nr:hypothetical protein [Candidatus Cloacimonadota bacterium]